MKFTKPNPTSLGLLKLGSRAYSPPIFGKKVPLKFKLKHLYAGTLASWDGSLKLGKDATLHVAVRHTNSASPHRSCWNVRITCKGGIQYGIVFWPLSNPSRESIEKELRKFERDIRRGAKALTTLGELT